jgi:hypothetical protein
MMTACDVLRRDGLPPSFVRINKLNINDIYIIMCTCLTTLIYNVCMCVCVMYIYNI